MSSSPRTIRSAGWLILLAACASSKTAAPGPASFDRYVAGAYEGEDALAARGEKLFDELDRRVKSDDFDYFCYVALASRIPSPRAVEILVEATLSQNAETVMLADLGLVVLSGRAAAPPKMDDLKSRYAHFRKWFDWRRAEGASVEFPKDVRAVKLPMAGTYGEMADALKKRAAEKRPPRKSERLRLDRGDLDVGNLSADAVDEGDVLFLLKLLAQKTD